MHCTTQKRLSNMSEHIVAGHHHAPGNGHSSPPVHTVEHNAWTATAPYLWEGAPYVERRPIFEFSETLYNPFTSHYYFHFWTGLASSLEVRYGRSFPKITNQISTNDRKVDKLLMQGDKLPTSMTKPEKGQNYACLKLWRKTTRAYKLTKEYASLELIHVSAIDYTGL